jgi:hypothetical protein
VQKLLAVFATGVLALVATGCSGSTSAVSANGNLKICNDFFAYESFIQAQKTQPAKSTVRHELQTLQSRLELDGPAASNKPLMTTASRAVEAIDTDNGDLANQLNASTSDCMLLGHLPPGASSSSSGLG